MSLGKGPVPRPQSGRWSSVMGKLQGLCCVCAHQVCGVQWAGGWFTGDLPLFQEPHESPGACAGRYRVKVVPARWACQIRFCGYRAPLVPGSCVLRLFDERVVEPQRTHEAPQVVTAGGSRKIQMVSNLLRREHFSLQNFIHSVIPRC